MRNQIAASDARYSTAKLNAAFVAAACPYRATNCVAFNSTDVQDDACQWHFFHPRPVWDTLAYGLDLVVDEDGEEVWECALVHEDNEVCG